MIKFSILVISLITVFITSSTTFTVAHAQQTPSLSHGLVLLAIGAALTAIPILIPTISSAIIGSNATVAQLNGSVINGLIGQ